MGGCHRLGLNKNLLKYKTTRQCKVYEHTNKPWGVYTTTVLLPMRTIHNSLLRPMRTFHDFKWRQLDTNQPGQRC